MSNSLKKNMLKKSKILYFSMFYIQFFGELGEWIIQVPHQKWATMSDSLSTVFSIFCKKECFYYYFLCKPCPCFYLDRLNYTKMYCIDFLVLFLWRYRFPCNLFLAEYVFLIIPFPAGPSSSHHFPHPFLARTDIFPYVIYSIPKP